MTLKNIITVICGSIWTFFSNYFLELLSILIVFFIACYLLYIAR
jgi:hypothetical protein